MQIINLIQFIERGGSWHLPNPEGNSILSETIRAEKRTFPPLLYYFQPYLEVDLQLALITK